MNLTLFCLVLFMYSANVGMLMTIIPLYSIAVIGADEIFVGFIISAYAPSFVLASPLWGTASDRFGRKRMLIFGMLVYSAIVFMFSLAGSPLQMVVIRLIEGFVDASFWTVPFALVADFCVPERMGEAMGKIGAFQSAGLIAGPLSSFFIGQFDYSSVFYTSSALAILAALVVLLGFPEKPKIPAKAEDTSKAWSNFKKMAKKNLIVACANYAFSAAFFGVSASQFVVHASSILGIERAYLVRLLLTIYLIVEAVVQFPSGKLSDIMGRRHTTILGFVASALGFSILSFAYSLEYLLIGIVMVGVGVGTLYAALVSLLMDMTSSSKRGLAAGLLNIAWGVGYFVGPFVGGIVSTYSFSAPYLFCIIMAAVGTILANTS